MSLVLDVVQNLVLQGVYELGCAAAIQVFKKCQVEDSKCEKYQASDEDLAEDQPSTGAINIPLPDVPNENSKDIEVNQLKIGSPICTTKTSCMGLAGITNAQEIPKDIEVVRPVSLLDVTLRNSGPISPPKTSCMRLARNSYFS